MTPKRKPGNPLSIYQKRKELSEVEQLRYELALAQIEIAELKKARCKEWRDVSRDNDVFGTVTRAVEHFSKERPAYALDCKTPAQLKAVQGF